jgi:ATP-dependent Clp protease ATP-binding subunit ClpA
LAPVPLKRVIQKEIANPLSKKLLSGELGKGQVVQVKGHDLGLNFE